MSRPDRQPARERLRSRAGLALLAAGAVLVAVAAVTLVQGLTGDRPETKQARTATVSRPVPLADRRMGIRLSRPAQWRAARTAKTVELSASDRRVGLSITTGAVSPRRSAAVSRALRQTLRRRYRARLLDQGRGNVASHPALLTAMVGRNRRGQVLEILGIAVASRWRTYAIVSFGDPRASQQVLREAQAVLRSLRFARPV